MRNHEAVLRRWLDRQDLTLEELVETTDALVGEFVPKQTRYKVTERPDARTVRYYVSEELLPKVVGYQGGRARYSGSHLIRLLLIKKLQADHQSLPRIKNVLKGMADGEVLAQLEVGTSPVTEPLPALVQVTPEIMSDPERRLKLAADLEQLAAWLRKSGGNT